MLTICLDESGIFEDENYTRPLIIGGIIYTGKDVKEEEYRIKDLYINTCKKIEEELAMNNGKVYTVEYPSGIHSTDNKGAIGKTINKILCKEIVSYIRKNKKYYITAMIKSNIMNEQLNDIDYDYKSNTKVTSIMEYDKGANLYERMATKFLFNNIFYNPILSELNKDVNLNLAKRTIKAEKDSELYNELIKLDYSKRINNDGTYRFYVTESSTFKAALSTKIYESNVNKNIDYKLNVQSIDYRQEGTTPFLYLADTVCNFIKEEVKLVKGGFDVCKLVEQINNKIGNEFICFLHDDVDIIWTKLIEKIKDKDLIGALEKIGEIEGCTNSYKDLYIKYWIPKIDEDLIKLYSDSMIDSYLAKLNNYFSKDISEYNKGVFIAEKLLDIIEKVNPRKKEIMIYKVNEKIALGCNHKGEISKALYYFDICEKLKNKGISIIEYINTINRKTITMTNGCDFEKSRDQLIELLPKFEKMKEVYLDVAADLDMESEDSYMISEEGKILSSIAQNYAFQRRYDEAKEYFLRAIDIFNDNSNKGVTNSYMTHMYIDKRDREEYEQQIVKKFCTTDLEEQLEKILSNPRGVDRYDIFIYVKALNEIYSNIVDKDFVEKVFNIMVALLKIKEFNQHPKEMVVKHLAQIMYKKGFINEADKLMKSEIKTIQEPGFTINIIVEKAQIDYLELKKSRLHVNNKIEIEKVNKEILKHIENIKSEVEKEEATVKIFNNILKTDLGNIEFAVNELNNILTYMYN